jgi:hypothetical protein
MVINYVFIYYTTTILDRDVLYTLGAMVFVFTIGFVFFKLTT